MRWSSSASWRARNTSMPSTWVAAAPRISAAACRSRVSTAPSTTSRTRWTCAGRTRPRRRAGTTSRRWRCSRGACAPTRSRTARRTAWRTSGRSATPSAPLATTPSSSTLRSRAPGQCPGRGRSTCRLPSRAGCSRIGPAPGPGMPRPSTRSRPVTTMAWTRASRSGRRTGRSRERRSRCRASRSCRPT